MKPARSFRKERGCIFGEDFHGCVENHLWRESYIRRQGRCWHLALGVYLEMEPTDPGADDVCSEATNDAPLLADAVSLRSVVDTLFA